MRQHPQTKNDHSPSLVPARCIRGAHPITTAVISAPERAETLLSRLAGSAAAAAETNHRRVTSGGLGNRHLKSPFGEMKEVGESARMRADTLPRSGELLPQQSRRIDKNRIA